MYVGHVAKNGRRWEYFQNLAGTPTGKRPLRRPRRRWKNNIRMDLKEIVINTRNWIDSAQVGIIEESL